jgi:hypothetical protein
MARLAGSVFLFLALLPTSVAQNVGATKPHDQPAKDPASAQLLASMNAACGWGGAIPATVTATGTITTSGGKSEAVIVEAKPGWLRIQKPESGVLFVVGGLAGQVINNGKIRQLNGTEAASLPSLMFPFYTELNNPSDASLSETAGTSTLVANKTVQIVNVSSSATFGDGSDLLRQTASKLSVAIEPDSLTPLQIRFFRMSVGEATTGLDIDAYLGDFRKVDGLLVPFRYEEQASGQSLVIFQFDQVILNASIPDSDFAFAGN